VFFIGIWANMNKFLVFFC